MDDGMLNFIITPAGTATLILLELQDFGLSVVYQSLFDFGN